MRVCWCAGVSGSPLRRCIFADFLCCVLGGLGALLGGGVVAADHQLTGVLVVLFSQGAASRGVRVQAVATR